MRGAVDPSLQSAPSPATWLAGTTGHETYVSVQLLRGVAALLVVIYHAGLMVKDRFPDAGDHFVLLSGAAGVDIFFPISGFVMLVSGWALLFRPDGWKVFIERRLIRIAPLYWLATSLKILAVLSVPALALHSRLGGWHTVASYLFISARNAEGATEPVLPVGWTLNYEMFFYLLFAVALLWRKPLVPTVSMLLLFVVGIGALTPRPPAPLTVFGPLVLEFGIGLWIAHLTSNGVVLGRTAAVIVFAAALAALVATDALPQAQIERGRLLLWGLPAAAMVMAAVSLEPWIRVRRWRLARLLGDASYSIYLSHGFVLPVIGIAAVKTGLHGIVGMTAGFALSVAASAAFGIATYLWVERPMTRALLRWRRSRAPVAAAVG